MDKERDRETDQEKGRETCRHRPRDVTELHRDTKRYTDRKRQTDRHTDRARETKTGLSSPLAASHSACLCLCRLLRPVAGTLVI